MRFWSTLSTVWRATLTLAMASIILLAVGVVVINRHAQSPPPTAVALYPSSDTGPPINVSALPATPPAKRSSSCPAASLADRNGAWVVPWLDGPGASDLVPSQAKRLGLLDFFWLALGPSPETVLQHPADPATRPLDNALEVAQSANSCGLRFVTTADNYSGNVGPNNAKVRLARILLDPQARWQHVQALAAEMARHPLADGLTVDYEFQLPEAADLALYARIGHLEKLLPDQPDQLVDRITTGYSRLIQDLALAMHHQNRQLRVATRVREQSHLDYGNLSAYIIDYGSIARNADQLVLMAYDYHWSSGDPGPIAPLDWVRKIWDYARTYNIPPERLSIALPAYAYNWPVDGSGKTVRDATDLTPTEMAAIGRTKVGGQDGETHYSYRDGQGGVHQVWDAASGLSVKTVAIRQICGCPVMAWKVGNADPVGSKLVMAALG